VSRVDPQTMICKQHNVEACIVCMCDDMYDWNSARREKRAQLKREWRETPIHERFDLGGES
jgi:hypothetical protein